MVGIVVSVAISIFPLMTKKVGLCLAAPVWLFMLYGYFSERKCEKWIRLKDNSIEYYCSAGPTHRVIVYKDIESVEMFMGGMRLNFKKGGAEKSFEITTSVFENSLKLRRDVRQRWQREKESRCYRPGKGSA
jgi:hypothetical protein